MWWYGRIKKNNNTKLSLHRRQKNWVSEWMSERVQPTKRQTSDEQTLAYTRTNTNMHTPVWITTSEEEANKLNGNECMHAHVHTTKIYMATFDKNYSNQLSMETNTCNHKNHSYKRETCIGWWWLWWTVYISTMVKLDILWTYTRHNTAVESRGKKSNKQA